MIDRYEDCYVVILAGGSGTRFWPKSRQKLPKQLCKIANQQKTMLELTLDRLDKFIPKQRRFIVTHHKQYEATRRLVEKSCAQIITEPAAKNTASALALSALYIESEHKKSGKNSLPIMVSLHADHMIPDTQNFQNSLKNAIELAQNNYLVLLGVQPTEPETAYGYIEKGNEILEFDKTQAYHVKSFREKPHKELASSYLKTGNFFWNSGLFVWSLSTFFSELDKYLPETLKTLRMSLAEQSFPLDIETALSFEGVYSKLENIAIDPALLEKSKKVAMIVAEFHWQDVGSWSALEKVMQADTQKNIVLGDSVCIRTEGTIIDSHSKQLVATVGVKNLVVVVTDDAVLVCDKNESQSVKEVVERLKSESKNHLL